MSKVEYRAVIEFLAKEGLAPAAIKQRLDGIELLVHRFEKCVEIKGDYIEK